MARYVTTNIGENECIGDSLVTINTNFENLDTKVEQVSSKIPSGISSVVGGTGTTNYIPKWSGSNTLGDSLVQVGTNGIGINGAPATNDTLKIHSGGRTLFTVLTSGAVGIAGGADLSPIPIDSTPTSADLHIKSYSSSILRITSLSANLGSAGGDAAIYLENADTDGTNYKRWTIHNDRSDDNNLDFVSVSDTLFTVTTAGDTYVKDKHTLNYVPYNEGTGQVLSELIPGTWPAKNYPVTGSGSKAAGSGNWKDEAVTAAQIGNNPYESADITYNLASYVPIEAKYVEILLTAAANTYRANGMNVFVVYGGTEYIFGAAEAVGDPMYEANVESLYVPLKINNAGTSSRNVILKLRDSTTGSPPTNDPIYALYVKVAGYYV